MEDVWRGRDIQWGIGSGIDDAGIGGDTAADNASIVVCILPLTEYAMLVVIQLEGSQIVEDGWNCYQQLLCFD